MFPGMKEYWLFLTEAHATTLRFFCHCLYSLHFRDGASNLFIFPISNCIRKYRRVRSSLLKFVFRSGIVVSSISYSRPSYSLLCRCGLFFRRNHFYDNATFRHTNSTPHDGSSNPTSHSRVTLSIPRHPLEAIHYPRTSR